MGRAIRVLITPKSAKVESVARITGAKLQLSAFGSGTSGAASATKPAKLGFHVAFLESAREDSDLTFDEFASLSGSVVRKGGRPVFVVGPDAKFEYVDPKLAESAFARKLALEYDTQTFDISPSPEAPASVLKLPREPDGTRFLEIAISLDVEGSPEAEPEFNDRLDVPLPPVRPSPTETLSGGCFAYDIAFPTPAVIPALRRARARAETDSIQLGVFAHADKVGSDAYNKDLTDRRARATLALLTGDLDEFEAVAKEEDWGVKVYQAMLRGLGCNPGPIDGVQGGMTKDATRQFQREYNQDLFHTKERARAHPDLVENGELDPPTKAALRDAYVSHFSQGLSPAQFAGPKFSGCSEFVPISAQNAENRRVTLALYEDLPPSDFPCVTGDHSKCDLDEVRPRRCRFYRKNILEPAKLPPVFFTDFEWLRRPDGRFHLSAITSATDGSKAAFRVIKTDHEPRSPPPNSRDTPGEPPELGSELGKPAKGDVKLGIVEATWTAPEGFDPFDTDKWTVTLGVPIFGDEDEPEIEPEGQPDKTESDDFFHPPLFLVEVDDAWAYSTPPGVRLARFTLLREDAGDGAGLAVHSEGFVERFDTKGERIEEAREVFVIGMGMSPADVIGDEGQNLG